MQGSIERDNETGEAGMSSNGAGGNVDVAIVGCGPVGAVLAILLGQAGHRVEVYEKHLSRYPQPRAVHFDHEIARILQRCGLGEAISQLSEPAPIYEWRNADGQVLLRFGGRPVGPSGWPDFNMFWQPAVEARLEEAAAALPPVTIRRGVTVTGLDVSDQHGAGHPNSGADHPASSVTVRLDTPAGPESVRARYVVGCDGANSTVRDLIGGTFTDLGFFFDWLIVDVAPHEPRTYDPVNLQVCDPARPTSVISGGPGRRRWEFMALPGETAEDLDREDTAWRLLEPWDIRPDNAELERHTVYRFHARWAEQWRKGPVFLAGDAAHQMPPFAGQGMCSGIRDAANLAWKLDLVLGGAADGRLLDAYQVEREANVRAIIDLSMQLGSVICVTDTKEAAERDEMLLSLRSTPDEITPPPPLPSVTAGVIAADDPLAGTLFVQGRVRSAVGTEVLADAMHGVGWRLIMGDPSSIDAVGAEPLDRFVSLGGSTVMVDAECDVDGTYADYFAEHGVCAVVQRPDFAVFGAARTPGDVDRLLDRLFAALSNPTQSVTPPGDEENVT